MLYDNISFTVQAQKWSYLQKVMLHAVMTKMVLIIYGEQKGRSSENDYVKFAYDVLKDYQNDINGVDAQANMEIANWSLDAYVSSIDKWIAKQEIVNDKDLYHSRASTLSVGLAALVMIPLLHDSEIKAMLSDIEILSDHQAITSSRIFDYCNMLFIEGMEIIRKKIGLKDKVESTSKNEVDSHNVVLPEPESDYIVRRTILWDYRKRALLLAVCGHLANVVMYEWPQFEPAAKFIAEAAYTIGLYKHGAHEKIITSALNVGTILIDELLISAREYIPSVDESSGKFDVYEMIFNSVRNAVECVHKMPIDSVKLVLNDIKFYEDTHFYDSEQLVALVNLVLTLAEDEAQNIKVKPIKDEEIEETYQTILSRKDFSPIVGVCGAIILSTSKEIISKQPKTYYKKYFKKTFKPFYDNNTELSDNDFLALEYSMRDWLWMATKHYSSGRHLIAMYITEAVVVEYAQILMAYHVRKRLMSDQMFAQWFKKYMDIAVQLMIYFSKDIDAYDFEPIFFNLTKIEANDEIMDLGLVDIYPFLYYANNRMA